MDIKKIVEIINKEGRQGPKNLKSNEVYEWIKKYINISYNNYINLLDENAIHEDERDRKRNAFFVIEKDGKYKLFKSKEEEIRKYICYIVRENPNITSGEARKKFKLIYQGYTVVDLMDQKNLSSNQDIIDQTIRNIMVSNYTKKKNNILFNRTKTKPFKYKVTEEGLKLSLEVDEILKTIKDEETLREQETALNELEIHKGINIYTKEELREIFEKNKSFNLYDSIDIEKYKKGRIPTDTKLKNTRLFNMSYACECNKNHKTFPTTYSENYMEGHHLVPVNIQRNFITTNLDCYQNIVSLCPLCHDQIHYGTKEAKKEIFDKIIKIRKDDLKSIGFTEEILKVIFETYY